MNEESTIMSDAHHNGQTGQAPSPVLSYTEGSGQHWSVPDWAPDMDWILITGTSVKLGLSELPQWRTDYSIIIFRHLSFLDRSQRNRGVLNFPTWSIAETGTWKVFYLFGFDQDLNDKHLKKSEPGVSINEPVSFLTVYILVLFLMSDNARRTLLPLVSQEKDNDALLSCYRTWLSATGLFRGWQRMETLGSWGLADLWWHCLHKI